MGQHSEHGGYIRGYAGGVLEERGPADTGATRDAIVNNLNHLHDSHSQCLATLVWPSGQYASAGAGDATTRPMLIPELTCVFPLHVRQDTGDTFVVVPHFRVELVDTAGDVDIIVRLQHGTEVPAFPPAVVVGDPQTRRFTVSAGAVHDEEPDPLFIPASRLRAAGGFTGIANITVWAEWTVNDAAAAIYAMNLREYIGD